MDSSFVVPATFQLQQIVSGTVRQVINEFLVDRRARACQKRTVEFYTVELKYFTRFLDAQGVIAMDELLPDVIRKYLLEVATHRNKGGTHLSYRVVKAFCNFWQTETDGKFVSPMKKVHVSPGNTQPLPGVTVDEFVRLVAACTTAQALRDKAIIFTLFDSAMRAGELTALNLGDLDPTSGRIVVKHGKGDRLRILFIGSKTRKAVRAYLRTRTAPNPNSPLFANDEGERMSFTALRQVVARASKRAGIAPHGLHDFRRGSALQMLRNKCDLVTISRLLGHASVVVTQRYLRQDETDLEAGFKAASPVDNLQ